MMQQLWNILDYDAVPVIFESAYDLDESVRRLVSATAVMSFTNQYAFGTVTAQKVTLQRVIPFYANGCKPCFYGKFQLHGDKVQLIGSFTISKFSKIWFSIGFWFVAVWTIMAFFGSIGTRNWWMAFAGIGFFLLMIGMILFSKLLARNDIAWLSQLIEKALGTPPKVNEDG